MTGIGVTDVARAAGVSIATVSRVINQPQLVAPKTRHRVSEAMKLLNFHVNTAASSLRRGHGKSVSVVVASMSQPWYVKLVRALRTEIGARGYTTMIYDLEHNPRSLLDYLETAGHQGASGVILATGDFLDSPDIVNAMTKANVSTPIVVIGQKIEDAPWSTIQFDDVKGSYEATKVLIGNSHHPVAFLGRLRQSYLAQERLRGYLQAMQESGLETSQTIWDLTDFGYQAGYREMARRLSEGTPLGAVLCVNDELALGATRAIADHGLRVPEDIQVMGYGNVDFLDYVLPSLSSVDGSASTVASIGVDALWSAFDGKQVEPIAVLERKLILRESTGHQTPGLSRGV